MTEESPTSGLSHEEDILLAKLLKKWTGGRISTPVFTELARIIPQPIIEVVLFRTNGDTLETLLIPRAKDDPVWPGMWHTPGTALRNADFERADQNPLNGALERIRREIEGDFAHHPVPAGIYYVTGSRRGFTVTQTFYTELHPESDRPDRVWYPVDELQENQNFIQEQLGIVQMAVAQYRLRAGKQN